MRQRNPLPIGEMDYLQAYAGIGACPNPGFSYVAYSLMEKGGLYPMDRHEYPFVAIVGQKRLKTALLLNSVDSRLGGVLLKG